MLNGLALADYQLVGWSWFGWDWNWFRRRTGEAVASRLVARASDGLIAVVHDGHHSNPRADRQYAAEAVGLVVPALRARGFELRTVCEDLDRVAPPEPDAGDTAEHDGSRAPQPAARHTR
jgi:peptidoglycan/xylan/chitin deacetylase (PgdA/CDA1 family)